MNVLSVFLFTREKKILNPRKFSIFCPRSFQTGREKILKTAQEKYLCLRKKIAKFNPRKKKCPIKKSNFHPSNLKKYLEIFYFLPEKEKQSSREKIRKCARENYRLPEKKKSARE